jgi:hypothetical protein
MDRASHSILHSLGGRMKHRHVIGLIQRGPSRRHLTDLVDTGLQFLGVGADTASTLAPIVGGGLLGAGTGAAVGAITGGNVGEAALIGGGVGALGGGLSELGGGGGATTATTDPATGAPLTTGTGTPAGSAAAPSGVSAVSLGGGGGGPIDPTTGGYTQPGGGGGVGPGSGPSGGPGPGGGGPGTPPVSSGAQIMKDLSGGNISALPGDVGSAIVKNPGAALAGGGLLLDTLKSNNVPGLSQLNTAAGSLLKQGNTLSSYINSGKLPPGAQTAIDLATKSAETQIRSKYASMGVNPETSTAATQEINNIRMNAATQGFTIAEGLLKTGIDETGLATKLYEQLVQINTQQAQSTGAAIASFAQALNGFSPGVSLKLAA